MFTIGADVEGVLVDNTGKLISSIGLIGGDKRHPSLVINGNLQEDNVLAEFAIDPVSDEDSFVHNIQTVIEQMKMRIAPLDLEYKFVTSAHYPEDQLQSRAARTFGCDPDYSAWTGLENEKPSLAEIGNLRTCGGHIHIGCEEFIKKPDDMSTRMELVRWMDFYLGIPSVLSDPDVERRRVYGRVGCFRPKPYGIEYRVLSNYWVKSEETIRKVFKAATSAYIMALGGYKIVNHYGDNIINEMLEIINTSDVKSAKKFATNFRLI